MNVENYPVASLETAPKVPPTLRPGDITPEIARHFENGCKSYISDKGIKEDEQVRRILNSCFQDNRIIHWVDCNRERFEAMSFAEFMVEFRDEWLEHEWARKLDSKLRVMRQKNRPFREWYNDFYSQTLLLTGTSEEMSEKDVRKLVYSLMDDHLRSRADLERIRSLTTLKAWTNALVNEDRAIRTDIAHLRKRVNYEGHSVANGGRNGRASSGPASTTSSDNQRARLPALTQDERALLDDHDGCYKCREFYVGHRSGNCTAGYPSGANYVRLSVARAHEDATKRGVKFGSKLKNKEGGSGKGKGVAAATIVDDEDDEDVEEVAVSAISGAVDYESESDVSRPIPRLSLPSLHWNALVWDGDDVPSLPATCLLDCGSQLVLVSESFVQRSGLALSPLPRPIKINVAIPEVPDSARSLSKKKEIVYNNGVSLTVSSSDNVWSSLTTTAVIVPRLIDDCDIILGLPWLSANKIVMDYEKRSAVSKSSGYDLLLPTQPQDAQRSYKRGRWTRNEVSTLRRNFRDMLRELEATLWRRNLTMCSTSDGNGRVFPDRKPEIVAAIATKITDLNEELEMAELTRRILSDYADVFGPVPRVADLPEHDYCRVTLKDPSVKLDSRAYPSPRKYREAWTRLIDDHITAGRIIPSSSQHSSPAFLVPKADPTADPRLVVDYRKLNANVVPDAYPLPSIPEIFSDCGKARFWCKFDMTNSFFQTRVHPDDRHLFAMNTPMGAFEWVVMPMGFKNAPSIHQRRMVTALREHLRRICHVFIDDCIGWANSLRQHEENVRKLLDACRANGLYLNAKKSIVVSTSVSFLGHVIDRTGLHADGSKVDKVLNWPVPRSVKDVRSFLGLVRYLSAFLPSLAQHTAVLDPLTSNSLKTCFPDWTPAFQAAFDGIKNLVVSSDCLTFIDHENPGDNKIFVTTDASNIATGAVLSFGPTWETARPVAFDSNGSFLRGTTLPGA
ncbi:hypothetical protein EST38_g13429 [Candolleomyces aberdarensis]|uniref:Reverse transcriptase domain-containing protein n=1 Tax=Candolleomyces aberdarensis TaxID=2316362 RepID=A0A4Q2D2P1_9AGAR|nr:hypothetical protein EST38_g13429 [Candolleomyces aberdarensis]